MFTKAKRKAVLVEAIEEQLVRSGFSCHAIMFGLRMKAPESEEMDREALANEYAALFEVNIDPRTDDYKSNAYELWDMYEWNVIPAGRLDRQEVRLTMLAMFLAMQD